MTEINIKRRIVTYIKDHFDMITDIDLDEVAATFIDNGGYDETKTFKENINELIKTMAIGKANNMFNTN